MEDNEQNSTVNTVNDEKQNRQEKKQNKESKPKLNANVINFIVKHFSIIWKVALVIFIILFIIGIIQILITMPGLILGKIKEFSANILSIAGGWFNGDNITAKISKEKEIELAQYIQDMGYDILGYGFGEATYEEDSMQSEKTGLENNVVKSVGRGFIDGIGDTFTGRTVTEDYLRAYMVQNEAIYTLTTWNLAGSFEALANGDLSSQKYAKGMINITRNGTQITIGQAGHDFLSSLMISIDRDKKLLRIQMGGVKGFFSQSYYYFNMSNWTSRYGKPLELFLALHLSTMMPDLAYDLATAECFNTKVNIDLQSVDATYTVSYKTTKGELIGQEEIERTYLNARWGITTSYAGDDFSKFYDLVMDYSNSYRYNSNKGIDLTYIGNKMKGEDAKYEDEDTVEIPLKDEEGNPILDEDGNPKTEEVKNEHSFSGKENNIDTWNSIIENSRLAGITIDYLKGFINLIEDGKKSQSVYWPRITSVENHWYYNEIKYEYGKAGKAYKTIKYEPDDPHNDLYGIDGQVILNTTFTSKSGVYYQLCEPEAEGPNEAIVALFKSGSGEINNIPYSFDGEYYRYDGTRETARQILNAKSDNNGYIFEGKTYPKEAVTVYKEPVSFFDNVQGESGNTNTYKNAYAAFAILEKADTEEAEASYRNLKELLVYLDYFTEDELKDPYYKVLDWLIPGNTDEDNITKDANKYGIIIKNSSGQKVIVPGDGKIINVDNNSVTIKFSKVDSKKMNTLNQRYADDFYSIDENCVLDIEMTISGITPSVSAGQDVSRGSNLGTAEEEVQVYMKYSDGSIIDDVTKYMSIIVSFDMDASPVELQNYAHELCMEYGWSEYDFECLVNLWYRESRWIPTAKNPKSGAYGIPQELDHEEQMVGEYADYFTNPATQIRWGLNYIKNTYTNPANAWAHSEEIGWY